MIRLVRLPLRPLFAAVLSPAAILLASCGAHASVDSDEAVAATGADVRIEERARFDQPWAAAFEPGTGRLFVTEKAGAVKVYDPASGKTLAVGGAPTVDYGGQGGLGDIAFAPDYPTSRGIYLTWVEAGPDDTRGAVLGRGTLACADGGACAIRDLAVIWRQSPKVTGRGHFSHRIAFSPDGQHLFLSSGERQKFTPAQDLTVNLGKVLRLNLDGTPAAGNPFSGRGGISAQIWSYGHRNLLGLKFDAEGRLWDLEHGPAGGDELNLVRPGQNYGWPLVSDGDNYDGTPIPRHATRPDLAAPAISWNPVIAPGDFVFYSGKLWPAWQGQAVIAAMKPAGLVRVAIAGESAREVARIPLQRRIREIVEAPDGALWLLEDGRDAALVRVTPGEATQPKN